MAVEGSHLLDPKDSPKLSGKAWGRIWKTLRCKQQHPRSVFFILGNEFCERFSFYGMKAILVIYLTQWLRYSDNSATALFHTFSMLCYVTPILGAVLSDGYIGKFRTILYLSIIYALGNVLMSLTALPPPESFGPVVGLLLIAFGTGGIKPCVSAFGGDQYLSDQTKELATFFSIFYFCINLGSLFSMILTPILRSDVQCFNGDCYSVAFGVPALLMIISLALFFFGRKQYKIYPPTGNVIGRMGSCICRAITNRCSRNCDAKDHWLDYASDTFEQPFIEDIKAVMRVLFLFVPLPVFWALFDQQGSRWTLQAVKMNGSMGVFGYVKPDQMQALNAILVVLMIPIFESIIYPLLTKCKVPNRPIQRMCVGMLLAASAFVVAGFLDLRIQASAPQPLPKDISNVRIINAAPCPVNIQTPFLNVSIHVSHASEVMQVPVGGHYLSFHATEGNYSTCDQLGAGVDAQLNLVVEQSTNYDVVILSYKDRLLAKSYNYSTRSPHKGGGLVSIIYTADSWTNHDKVIMKNIHHTYKFNLVEYERTPFIEINAGRYAVEMDFNNSNNILLGSQVLVDSGASYTILVQPNVSDHHTFEMVDYRESSPYQVPIWHQVPQYVLITAGEILFSITGLQFAYTQAPATMKSVLQAAWLLTVGVGNLIVIIAAEVQLIPNQAMEFFTFAVVMVFDTAIFGLVGYFYVYIKQERDYDELSADHDTLISEPEEHALDEKPPQPINETDGDRKPITP